jgi:hypothetical protein
MYTLKVFIPFYPHYIPTAHIQKVMAYLYAYLDVPEGSDPPEGWELVDMEKFRRDARRFSEIIRRHGT